MFADTTRRNCLAKPKQVPEVLQDSVVDPLVGNGITPPSRDNRLGVIASSRRCVFTFHTAMEAKQCVSMGQVTLGLRSPRKLLCFADQQPGLVPPNPADPLSR